MDTQLAVIWENVLSEIKPQVSDGKFGTLLKPTQLLSLADGAATIQAPSPIIINMLRERFMSDIKTLLEKHTKEKVRSIAFVSSVTQKKSKKSPTGEPPLLTIDTEL